MRSSIIVKLTAFILCTAALISTLLSGLAIVALVEGGFYTRPFESIREGVLSQLISSKAEDIAWTYHYGDADGMDRYSSESNFYFEITDSSGNTVYTNYAGQKTDLSITNHCTVEGWVYLPSTEPFDTADESLYFEDTGMAETLSEDIETGIRDEDFAPEEEFLTEHYEDDIGHLILTEYTVTAYLPSEYFTIDMISFTDGALKALYSVKSSIYIIGGASLLVFIISLVLLLCCAGHKKGEEKPRTCPFNRIPFDVFTAIYALIITLILIPAFDFYFEEPEILLYAAAAVTVGSFVIVSYLYSLAARAKTGELFKNTAIWWIIKNVYRAVRFVLHGLRKVLLNLPLYGKTILLLALYAVFTLLLMISNPIETPIIVIFWVISGTITALVALYLTNGVDKLKKGAESIARGDYSYRIDTKHMLPSLKEHADSLGNISLGMSKALEERLKSERFKTELITNVSHDLKTPLTSIVNYVGLIKDERASENPDEGRIDEYIEVLDRQSERLRKLTVDLVEASKASTGNLEVSPTPIELGEMLTQTQGEYAEKLSESGLELILHKPAEPIRIMADGKHLWRIFDNLMNNIAKYAMPGTRVYLDLSEKAGRAYVIFKNTSKYELNISADELTERFVRGDSSRHTEGSGLGLSIARSLAELGGGKLDIYIDGDLFKAVVSFDCMKKTVERRDTKNNDIT